MKINMKEYVLPAYCHDHHPPTLGSKDKFTLYRNNVSQLTTLYIQ